MTVSSACYPSRFRILRLGTIFPYPEEQDDEDAYEAELEAFDNIYWNPKQVNGAIPICHQGCAYRNWLVITGAEAGNVWEDLRADEKGLRPVKSKSK